jgi:oxalate decarboxylase/phosphoglucose isomerase-like protein (cupin superfamily)
MNNRFQKYSLKTVQGRGAMITPVELKDYIPFAVKRFYFLTKPKGETGQHCHFEEQEFFVMIQGSCKAVIDKGRGREEIDLSGPGDAIFVPNYVWHGFRDFTGDAIVAALSSTNYKSDRSDYMENYEEYLKIRDKNLKSK